MKDMPMLLRVMKKGLCPVYKDAQGFHPNGLSKQQLYAGVHEVFEYVYRNPSVLNPVVDVREKVVNSIVLARETHRKVHNYRTFLELNTMVKLAARAGLLTINEVELFLDLDGLRDKDSYL